MKILCQNVILMVRHYINDCLSSILTNVLVIINSLRERNKRMRTGVIRCMLLLFCVSCICACDAGRQKGRVFLMGIDGATWKVITPMLERGELPNIKKIMEQGSYGPLKTDVADSPISWTSIITGKSREKHGINYDLTEVERRQDERLVKTNRLWDILLYYGKKVGVYRWYLTSPYRKVNGFWVPREDEGSMPEEQQNYLKEALYDGQDALLSLMRRYPCDCVMAFWHDVDWQQHAYWLYHEMQEEGWGDLAVPKDIKKEIEQKAEIIHAAYRQFDNKLGMLLKGIGRNDSIIVVSDHGITLQLLKHVAMRTEFLKAIGISAGWFDDEKIVAQGNAQGVFFTVEVQYPLAYIEPKFFSVDSLAQYQETVTMPLITITFDQKAESADTYAIVKQQLSNILTNMMENEKPVFEVQETTQDTFTVELSKDAKAYCATIREHETALKFFDVFVLTAEHGPEADGIIFLYGPTFKKHYKLTDAHLYDVVPTILTVLNLPVGKDMDGQPLLSSFNSFPERKVRYIDSYDAIVPMPPVMAGGHAKLTEGRKRYLRSLGYIQ